MIQAADEVLRVRLTPDNVDGMQAAGVRFARALAGAPIMAFMLALGEQEQLVRSAPARAEFSERTAGTAADAFEVGARLEWERIAPAAGQGVVGRMSTLNLPVRKAPPTHPAAPYGREPVSAVPISRKSHEAQEVFIDDPRRTAASLRDEQAGELVTDILECALEVGRGRARDVVRRVGGAALQLGDVA